MTTEELYERAVQTLAEAVMEKIRQRQKQALVVYTGSNIGFEPGLESLRQLRVQGFTFRVLLSRGASHILDVESIRRALEPEELWVDRPGDTPEALTAKYDTILVPALTVNTAAHVASCMADAPASAVILDGMMRGKNVVIAVDGACPDNEERARRGFRMAEPLKQRLRDNLDTLRAYGGRLTTADRLCQKALGTLGRLAEDPRPQTSVRTAAVAAPKGKVLSGLYVKNCPPHSILRVPKGMLVTQLATEEALRRDVRILVDET